MSLPPGASFGPYQVIAPLGAGGMGEVYRARDTKLDRDVALKTLPDTFANDAERLARFEREAKTLASLNHPHIAQVYAIEGRAIVMELVEGEDLSERLKRGPVPLEDALPFARQIAEALEAAHDAGIVHRDLKPANVKVRPDGTVKVLDFGLAKPGGPAAASGAPENSPTITTPAMTLQGAILGTAAYMAPEQAKGKFVDRRADIWAFGCVLYEMLTGARTFAGEDVSDTLVSILRDDPRWTALPAATPPNVRQLLRRCLQKDPQKRLPHIGVARIELTENSGEAQSDRGPGNSGRRPLTLAAVGALAGGVIVAGVMFAARPAPAIEQHQVVQFTIDPAPGSNFTGANGAARFAVSPDGRQLVYQMQDASGAQLFIRPLESSTSQPVPGTVVAVGGGDAQQAFWSPDGRFLAFFDESKNQLKKLDRTNGLVQVIAEVQGNQLGGSWSDAGTIMFASLGTLGVRSVSSSGGAVTQVTKVDSSAGDGAHLWPDFLPDGRHFVYQAQMAGNQRAIFLGSLEGGAPVRLFESQTAAVVARPDQLLFGHDGSLMSLGFDMQTLRTVGEPRIIADQVPATAVGRLAVSASRNGVLAYGSGLTVDQIAPLETYWIDRSGKSISNAPPSVPVGGGIRLSQDGRSLVYVRGITPAGANLWIQDTVRGIETRLRAPTLGAVGTPSPPAISPDGSRVLYRQTLGGAGVMLVQPAAGTTEPVELLRGQDGEGFAPFEWAQDGRLLFSRGTGPAGRKLYFLRNESDRQPVLYLEDIHGPWGASLSPDGRWLAYATGERPQAQVFVQSFPDPTLGKVTVSAPGAAYPRWHPKGGELFFVDNNFRLMAVPVKTNPQLEVGPPVALFGMNLGGANPASFISPFDVMPDGSRFVAVRPTGATVNRNQSIVVTVNGLGTAR